MGPTVTGHPRGWVRDYVKRFNGAALDGLADRRETNGTALKLDEASIAALKVALEAPSPDGGLWNGNKVRRWIAEGLGDEVGKRIGWRYRRRCGFTLQRPQTRHADADVDKQEAFKK